MKSCHDIHLPLTHRSGIPAIIKAKDVLLDGSIGPAWVLPGGMTVASEREAERKGIIIFKSAGWK